MRYENERIRMRNEEEKQTRNREKCGKEGKLKKRERKHQE